MEQDGARLRVGLVGAGLVGQAAHAHFLWEERERFDSRRWPTPPPPCAPRSASATAIRERHASLDGLLGLGLDAVVVAVPDAFHADIACRALEAGLHVLCEKPLALSLEECDRIAAARDAAGRVLHVGTMKRYDPAYLRLLELLPAGAAEVHYLSVEVRDPGHGPFVAHLPMTAPSDLAPELGEELRARMAARMREAAGGEPPPGGARAFGAYLSSLVHDVSLLQGVLEHLGVPWCEQADDGAWWDEGRGVSLSARAARRRPGAPRAPPPAGRQRLPRAPHAALQRPRARADVPVAVPAAPADAARRASLRGRGGLRTHRSPRLLRGGLPAGAARVRRRLRRPCARASRRSRRGAPTWRCCSTPTAARLCPRERVVCCALTRRKRQMEHHGPRISRSALARMTGATALGLAVAPEVAARAAAGTRRAICTARTCSWTAARAMSAWTPTRSRTRSRASARRATDGRFPGAVALVARRGIVVGERAFGVRLAGSSEATTTDTIYDLESMTKVLATATAAMLLADRGKLSLSAPVARYLPHFAANGKGGVLVRDLLRYSSGLPIDNQKVDTDDVDAIWRFMEETPLEYPTGSMVEYSDLGYRLLGRLVEAVAGMSLDAFAKREIWGPLGMADTTYNPGASLVPRCAATGPGSLRLRPGPLRGSVQDDQDWKVGGIVGCDGAFATARDVAIFSQMILNGGSYGDVRLLPKKLVAAMVANQTPQVTEAATDTDPTTNLLFTPKGYGFELWTHRFSPGGMRLSPGSYGKSGGAGTFMWIDPKRELIAILLTNHGLPVPFDQPGWNLLIDEVAVAEFCDGVVNAVRE